MKPVFGLTHDLEGHAQIRVPKVLKVGIGLSKGPDIHVCLDSDAKAPWVIQVGVAGPKKHEVTRYPNKEACLIAYRELRKTAPEREFPKKLPYFSFTKIGPDGQMHPDFGMIEKAGPRPVEIDIVFIDNDPFDAAYEMWTATEKKCSGDGLNAERVLSMASTPEEKERAEEAKDKGLKTFPIIDGCKARGCPYASPQGDRPAQCKPRGRLFFQMLAAPRLGSTAYLDTTSFRSVSQLFSCLMSFKTMTGRGDPERGFLAGIPFKLVVRPFKTTYGDKKKHSSTAYSVYLDFDREADVLGLKQKLISFGAQFNRDVKQLPAATIIPEALDVPADHEDEPEPVMAKNLTDEFYVDNEGEEDLLLALDQIIDPTLSGRIYGALKAKGHSRTAVDRQANELAETLPLDEVAAEMCRRAEIPYTAPQADEPPAVAPQDIPGMKKGADIQEPGPDAYCPDCGTSFAGKKCPACGKILAPTQQPDLPLDNGKKTKRPY